MSDRNAGTPVNKVHQFGGDWTSAKLAVLEKYLAAYATALKDKPSRDRPFKKAYIDAFAGTGYRSMRRPTEGATELLFPDLAEPAPQDLLDGSARIALRSVPPFDRYIFIERSAGRCAGLTALASEFPALEKRVLVQQGDANEEIQKLCVDRDWSAHRAVLFLDPYGMQVEWRTIEAIASTRAIDLWLLFPLGIGVNRLLTRTGDIPSAWRQRLNILLGVDDWYDEFYRVNDAPTLFGDERGRLIKASTETIGRYFNRRLKDIFAGVIEKPGVLRNSSNNPLYLLCFAVGNARGKDIALRIAGHLVKELR